MVSHVFVSCLFRSSVVSLTSNLSSSTRRQVAQVLDIAFYSPIVPATTSAQSSPRPIAIRIRLNNHRSLPFFSLLPRSCHCSPLCFLPDSPPSSRYIHTRRRQAPLLYSRGIGDSASVNLTFCNKLDFPIRLAHNTSERAIRSVSTLYDLIFEIRRRKCNLTKSDDRFVSHQNVLRR